MKSIDVISAGAGSGKTTRLAQRLAERIASDVVADRVRPEGVIAVTFTVTAAAELARRVREELLRRGKVDEAHRIGAARIGTVHAVCGRLVSDFAFELGISPDLRVLDEDSASDELKRSLSAVLTREEADELADLESRLPDLEWEEAVRLIQEKARSNGIDSPTLKAFEDRSVEELTRLLGDCGQEIDGEAFDRTLESSLETFISAVEAGGDPTKTTASVCDKVRSGLAQGNVLKPA